MHTLLLHWFIPETRKKHAFFIITRWTQKLHHYENSYLFYRSLSTKVSLLHLSTVQYSRSLFLLMGCLHTCFIPTVPLWTRKGWHLLLDLGLWHALCACAYSFNMGQGSIITSAEQRHNYHQLDHVNVYSVCWIQMEKTTFITSCISEPLQNKFSKGLHNNETLWL
jgi:hypothetical protein